MKAVVFDLDDTLYSEKEYVRSGYRAVAEYLGNSEYAVRLWNYFNVKKPAIDELLKEIGREDEKAECLKIYRAHKPELHLYNGVVEMIQEIRNRGIKTGIITDGRPEGQRNKINALDLRNLVDDIIITDELGGVQFRKPCDIAFRIMMTKWRLHPADIVYVGDNPAKDFQAPRQLGIRGVQLMNPDGLYGSDVHGVGVTSIKQVKDVLNYLEEK